MLYYIPIYYNLRSIADRRKNVIKETDMYLTYAIYFLCLCLFIWGISFAKRGQFHDDYLGRDVMMSIRGFAAIGVILHHISQEEVFQAAGEIGIFVNAGYLFVSLFFFSSGYGLMKNLDTKPDYLDGFLKKRLPVIIIPFYTSIIFYGIFNLIMKNELAPVQWITNIIGVTMMNEYAWYPVILTILYIAFWLIFKGKASRSRKLVYMFAVIIVLGLIFCVNGHFLWWAGSHENWWMDPSGEDMEKWYLDMKVFWLSGEWWVNSPMAFLLGMVYETNEEKLSAFFKKLYPLKIVILAILTYAAHFLTEYAQMRFGFWTEFAGNGPAIKEKMITLLSQYPHVILFTLFIIVFTMKIRTINPVTKFFGKYSLDTYMMNLMTILAFRPIFLDFPGRKVKDPLLGRSLFVVCVFAASIILGIIYHKINALIRAKITPHTTN